MATSQVTINHEVQWARRTSLCQNPWVGPTCWGGDTSPEGRAKSTAKTVGIRAPLPQGNWLLQVKSWGLCPHPTFHTGRDFWSLLFYL